MSDTSLTQNTREYYDRIGRDLGTSYEYERWFKGIIQKSHYNHTRKSIEWAIRDNFGAVERCLEIGCGVGTWTDLFLQCSDHMSIVDISEELLNVVKEKYKNKNKVDYMCCDFIEKDLPLLDSFDAIFSIRALEYMSDKRMMAKRCYDYLRENGKVVIITKNPLWRDKTIDNRKKVTNHHNEEKGNDIQTGWIPWKDLRSIFLECNFRDVRIYPVAMGSYYRPYNNLIGTKACDFIHGIMYKRHMRGIMNNLTESYLLVGKK
jgi:SAM-dependent methyltransferase